MSREHERATAEALEEAVRLAHSLPHTHEVNGKEIGHHRLFAAAIAGTLPGNVRCGLLAEHPAHEWTEHGHTYPCGGRPEPSPAMSPEIINVLDELAEAFKREKIWSAYHHIRAVAHDLGWHLSGCTGGKRPAPEGPNW